MPVQAAGALSPRQSCSPFRDETRIIVLELARERRAVGVVVDDDIPPRLIHREVEWISPWILIPRGQVFLMSTALLRHLPA